MQTGTMMIKAERERQRRIEGWSDEHDATHTNAELSEAAASYLTTAICQVRGNPVATARDAEWPFEPEAWNPSEDPIRNLVKAGALIAAEIDRLSKERQAIETAKEHAPIVSRGACIIQRPHAPSRYAGMNVQGEPIWTALYDRTKRIPQDSVQEELDKVGKFEPKAWAVVFPSASISQ